MHRKVQAKSIAANPVCASLGFPQSFDFVFLGVALQKLLQGNQRGQHCRIFTYGGNFSGFGRRVTA
jgi:hypothetical protein